MSNQLVILKRGEGDSIIEYSKNTAIEPGIGFKHAAYRTPKDLSLRAFGEPIPRIQKVMATPRYQTWHTWRRFVREDSAVGSFVHGGGTEKTTQKWPASWGL